MDKRIWEVEQLIQTVNSRSMELKSKALQSVEAWSTLRSTWSQVKRVADRVEVKSKSKSTISSNQPICTCGHPLAIGAKFCKYCGVQIASQVALQATNQVVEPEPMVLSCICGKEIVLGAKFCKYCGRQFGI